MLLIASTMFAGTERREIECDERIREESRLETRPRFISSANQSPLSGPVKVWEMGEYGCRH